MENHDNVLGNKFPHICEQEYICLHLWLYIRVEPRWMTWLKKKKELVIFFNEIYTGWIIGKKQKEVETCSSEMRSLMPDSEPGRTI